MKATKRARKRLWLIAWGMLLIGACNARDPQATPSAKGNVEQVCQITAEQLGVERSKVQPSSTLNDFGADELDEVELVMSFEEAFDVSLPDEELDKLAGEGKTWGTLTMSQWADLVQRQSKR